MNNITFLFFSIMFLIGTDTFLISPLLPALTKIYHISADVSGWMVSAYALGYATFALIAGPISDYLDRKKVMIFGMIGFAISTFLCGLAPNFWTMMLFRLLAGISAAFITPQVWASIPVLVAPKNIVKTMGYTTAGLSLSQMIGIPIGSYLAAMSWHAPFFAIACCSVILMIGLLFILPSLPTSSNTTNKRRSIIDVYLRLFKTPTITIYIIAYFIFQTGNFAAFSFIGSWLSSDFQLHIAEVGTAMIALGLVIHSVLFLAITL
ncbi:MFS transporter [Heyndrickxia ginsengihumi]|uniref:MFS transporter n=1 Tax=Heyndrickxia ginsengihumi TaxID=363870 RepID=UPI003D1EAF3E